MKTDKIILDSNVWISIFFKTEINNRESLALISSLIKSQKTIIVPFPVIIETIAVLNRYRVSPYAISAFIKNIKSNINYEIVDISGSELENTALTQLGKIFLKAQDFTIYLYHVILKTNQLITYDKEFKQQILKQSH